MNLGHFFAELKRRNVYKVAIVYAMPSNGERTAVKSRFNCALAAVAACTALSRS